MSIRFYLLSILLLFYVTGMSQRISIDSVEVSIVIPEHHKKQIITQQDTLVKEINPEILKKFQRVDSILPEQRPLVLGRVQIRIDDPYSSLARPIMQHQSILKMLVFDDGVSKTFNPFRLRFLWPDPPKYKPFAFSLKYKARNYGFFENYKSPYRLSPLEKYHQFLEHPSRVDTFFTDMGKAPVKGIMDKMVIEEPQLTDDLWDSIPEPPTLSFGGGFLEKKSASEGLNRLILWEPATQGKLDKKDKIVRDWTYGGTENIQFSQAFQENWVKGGENSIALLSDLRLQARYKKDKVEWESYGIHKLGVLSSEDDGARINDDVIELNTKYGVSAGRKWYYSGLFNFKTQFFNGYEKSDDVREDPISGFIAPGYLTLAVGMDYKEENFTLMLLPVTSKMTIVADTTTFDQTRYKIPEDKKVDNMGGMSLVNNFGWEFSEGFNLSSRFDFFYEYMRRDNQVQAEWELILDMKINIFMSARVSTNLRYFSNESEYVQFRENLSISFNYRF